MYQANCLIFPKGICNSHCGEIQDLHIMAHLHIMTGDSRGFLGNPQKYFTMVKFFFVAADFGELVNSPFVLSHGLMN
jgi:hypothetical protein